MEKQSQPPVAPSAGANLIPPRSPSSPNMTRGRARSSSIADLLATPPPVKPDAAGKPPASEDWQTVKLGSLTQNDKLVSITGDIAVEAAYGKLIQHNFTSLPVLIMPRIDVTQAESFDYSDISALLLLIMGHLKPQAGSVDSDVLEEMVRKARAGFDVPVSFVMGLSPKDPFLTLQESETVLTAVEYFGRGVHRLLITDDAEREVKGLLSQRRLVTYLWDNARRFPSLEPLFQMSLHELGIGSSSVISIAGDKLVIEALETMHHESVSSLAVVDADGNLLGNISIVDVKHLTKSTSAHLLHSTCLQFLTVILTDRGLENGKDSYPVFHVTPISTLAHTIAKLVATKSHRMWIVQPPNHQPFSPPSTPSSGTQTPAPASLPTSSHSQQQQSPASPSLVPVSPPTQFSASRGLGGKLIGVISLTDVLSLLAKSAGKGDVDPSEARRQRRRSSSSSTRSFSLDSTTVAAAARRSVSIERPPYVGRGSIDRGSRR
ncbi:hypothetical protein V1508DRAFT_379364 [Lipomyces doorenjongii]|uniref:uncharacterized protein n=1 Tax=Lipomyces doorenjongii TaxID=383834 RepID=UPI0034CE0F08